MTEERCETCGRSDLHGHCACGTIVWDGGPPKITELVICPDCYTDCSIPLTALDKAADWKRRVYKRMRLLGMDFDTAAAETPHETERERAYESAVERLKAAREKVYAND